MVGVVRVDDEIWRNTVGTRPWCAIFLQGRAWCAKFEERPQRLGAFADSAINLTLSSPETGPARIVNLRRPRLRAGPTKTTRGQFRFLSGTETVPLFLEPGTGMVSKEEQNA
jgi:hypothetical protein